MSATTELKHPDEPSRVRAGASPASPPEILRFLARDRSVMVRAAVAMNAGTPVAAAHALAGDDDERVRAVIARRLGAMASGLREDDQEALRRQTYAALAGLVTDEAVRVRAALADVLKEMPDAPRALVVALAHDQELSVAEPVIRLSPVLTDQDLLGLLSVSSSADTAIAVARRPDLTESVCDAVAATASVRAIAALLANRSAAIREATLDALIAQAAEHVDWHEPLVRRPALSPVAARTLSEVVATHLLETLAARNDLSPDVKAERGRRLSARLRPEPVGPVTVWSGAGTGAGARPPASVPGGAGAPAVTEAMVLRAAQRGDVLDAARLLAAAAGVPTATVERAALLRSAKGLLSLVWKAGFTMRLAGPLQSVLARLAPDDMLAADAGEEFPLSREEMRWQLDFLARLAR